MTDKANHPESRDPKTAFAHTIEEGGEFFPGCPEQINDLHDVAQHGYAHSLFFEDGWVFDASLRDRQFNGGWRPRKGPGEIAEIKRLLKAEKKGIPRWLRPFLA